MTSIDKPKILAVTGVDGSGKTTLTSWLQIELGAQGYQPGFVWSRFNNYCSLPFLALTRLSGHNYYKDYEGVRMGFHDFEKLAAPLRYLFVGLQAVDVNLATLSKIRIPCRNTELTICERGPWDTLVDVATDTGLTGIVNSSMARVYYGQLAGLTDVVLIDRDADLIEKSRPELKYDAKLRERQVCYRKLAEIGGWKVLANNGDIEDTRSRFLEWLAGKGYQHQER